MVETKKDDLAFEQQTNNKQKGGYRMIEPRWKPGQSGNPAGRPVNKSSITYWYKKLLAENEGLSAKKIAKMAIEKATEGSLPHIQEVTDRTDGKVIQQTDHTFDGEGLMSILLKLRGNDTLAEPDIELLEEGE